MWYQKDGFRFLEKEHKELVTQMRMARYRENGNTDKDETSNNTYDAFDSARLVLKMFEMNVQIR